MSILLGFVAGCGLTSFAFYGWRRDLLATAEFWRAKYVQTDEQLHSVVMTGTIE